jgi:hypothetical protein
MKGQQVGYKDVGRTDEMKECGRGGKAGGKRPGQGNCWGMCGCSVTTERSNTTLQFLWQQRIFDELLEGTIVSLCPDLLSINTGGDDIFQVDLRPTWNSTLQEQASQLRVALQHILAFCPRTHLIWRTTTPVCGSYEGASSENLNAWVDYSNTILKRTMDGLVRTRVLDVWASNLGRCSEYSDWIHHDKLAYEPLEHMLIDFCSWTGHSV